MKSLSFTRKKLFQNSCARYWLFHFIVTNSRGISYEFPLLPNPGIGTLMILGAFGLCTITLDKSCAQARFENHAYFVLCVEPIGAEFGSKIPKFPCSVERGSSEVERIQTFFNKSYGFMKQSGPKDQRVEKTRNRMGRGEGTASLGYCFIKSSRCKRSCFSSSCYNSKGT